MKADLSLREPLCYPCALRMSLLFQSAPPLSYRQLRTTRDSHISEHEEYCKKGFQSEDLCNPFFDYTYHTRFIIVYETSTSIWRYLRGKRLYAAAATETGVDHDKGPSLQARGAGNARNSYRDAHLNSPCVMFTGEDASRYNVSWLCVACYGLYQFLDCVHAPMLAAEVRQSAFVDSASISINIKVSRSFTFTWLAVATRYFDQGGTMTERPSPSAIVPVELSNFKEFYMSDLRARMLQYLLRSHSEVVAGGADSLPGMALYLSAIQDRTLFQREEYAAKVPRVEQEGAPEVPTCKCPQAFSYNTNDNCLVCEVYCRHYPTEMLLMQNTFPKQYASNKDGGGVLTYSIIYDHVLPYLQSIGWGLLPTGSDVPADVSCQARESATVFCSLTHANIFIRGVYRKMQRNLSQSPWFVNGVRVGSYSLQEIIANMALPFFFPEGIPCRVVEGVAPKGLENSIASEFSEKECDSHYMKCFDGNGGGKRLIRDGVNPSIVCAKNVLGYGCYKFHSAGREDVDVRMLGTGRPFVLEIINPSRDCISVHDLKVIESCINASHQCSVEVDDLRVTDAQVTVRLARHSESKVKQYRCIVWSSRSIEKPSSDRDFIAVNGMRDLAIEQKTPLRVLHRRSLHSRLRVVHSMTLIPLNTHWFMLDLETQAGTYVKEFVHGDMGRTVPNLGTLLKSRMDIIQLDVVGMSVRDLDV